MRNELLLSLFVVGPILSGCLSSPSASSPLSPALLTNTASSDWAARALVFGTGHDHTNPLHHQNLSTPNFQLLGWDPLFTDYYGKTAGGYLCGNGAQSGGRDLAVISSFTTNVAFVLVDVTDPTHPTKVAEYVMEGVKTYDVALTADGRHVLVAADVLGGNEDPRFALSPSLPSREVRLLVRTPCNGEFEEMEKAPLPLMPGVVLVGIQDPAHPTLEDFAPTPVIGPHSVASAKIGGKIYAIASITNLVHAASYFNFYEVVETPLGGRLVLLSTVDAQQYGRTLVGFAALGNGHVDARMILHPKTGKPVAYLADWDGGLILLDLSNPSAPLPLSFWADTGPDGGAVHSVVGVPELWEGRHYVIVGQEFLRRPSNRPTGWIYILDDTDPTRPFEVSRWTLPVDTQPNWGNNELFSTHYFDLINRTLFVSMYHGGVWAVDLTNVTTPRTIGVYLPALVPPNPPRVRWEGQIRAWPYVLNVIPSHNGTLTVFESTSGVYSLKFDPTLLPPLVPEWPKEGKHHETG